MKKYELITNDWVMTDRTKLFRIRALRAFGNIKAGDLGGYIEKESNLSQEGECWAYDKSFIFGNATVKDNAVVCDNAQIRDNACISDNVIVRDKVFVADNACISDNVTIYGNTCVYSHVCIGGDICIGDCVIISGHANIKGYGNGFIGGNTLISGNACIDGNVYMISAWINGNAYIKDNADYVTFTGFDRKHIVITFFRDIERKISVTWGSFWCGEIGDFRKRIKNKYKDSKIGKEYLMLIDLIEQHFKEDEE